MTNQNNSELKLLTLAQSYPCSYLSHTQSNSIFIDSLTPPSWEQYCQLSKVGFRRSGGHFYRPECPSCNACKSSRIRASEINLNAKRLKRILNKTLKLSYSLVKPASSDEHYKLYESYISHKHADGDMYPASREQYDKFLVSDNCYSYFFEVRDENHCLVICTAVDMLDDGISAIYTYYDINKDNLSLGTLSILLLCKLAREHKLPFVYLGYWVKNSKKMNYKAQFKPLEIYNDDIWEELPEQL